MATGVGGIEGRLIENDQVCHCLYNCIRDGSHGLDLVPDYVKKVIREGCWRTRWVQVLRQTVEFTRFEDYVAAQPPEGLGASLKTMKNLCQNDNEARNLIDQATANPPGRPSGETVNIVNGSRPQGNSKDAAIRRLRKDRPDLLERVEAGEISAHAAAVEAGFRKLPTPIDLLKRSWAKASKQDKEAFMNWAGNQGW